MAPTTRELDPTIEACRSLCSMDSSGMERRELADLLIRLAEGRVDLEQALDDLNDEQQGLRDENAKIHEAIALQAGHLRGSTASDWRFLESSRDVFGRWWEQGKEQAQPIQPPAFPEAVSAASPSELGKQFVEQWQQLGQQMASRFGSSMFHADSRTPEAAVQQDEPRLGRLVLNEVYRHIGKELCARESEGKQQEAEAASEELETASEETEVIVETPVEQTGSLSALWALPAQWQQLGRRVADTLYGRPKEEASKPLGRIVLNQLYTTISQKYPQGAQAGASDEAAEAEAKVASAQQTGLANALWAVTLHWQHFGASDRAGPGTGSPKLGVPPGSHECEQDACEPLEEAPLDQLHRSLDESILNADSEEEEGLPEEAEGEDSAAAEDKENRPEDGSHEFGSPHHLGMQFVDQWQQWGKRVNERFSDYVVQGSLGWQSFTQALTESEPQRKKKKKKAKKDESTFFAQETEKKGMSEEKKEGEAKMNEDLVKSLGETEKLYLKALFSLSEKMYPHELKF
mmetsp:Transcript_25228/g.80163  ORF Transcript_25228/g.80163 Transcript_25228/m.80163 type:complete len:518 (+) Transcript_25228:37-1590(+)